MPEVRWSTKNWKKGLKREPQIAMLDFTSLSTVMTEAQHGHVPLEKKY